MFSTVSSFRIWTTSRRPRLCNSTRESFFKALRNQRGLSGARWPEPNYFWRGGRRRAEIVVSSERKYKRYPGNQGVPPRGTRGPSGTEVETLPWGRRYATTRNAWALRNGSRDATLGTKVCHRAERVVPPERR
jgi:hypothetical protein